MVTAMSALRAHVENGRIVVDDPTDLPDGTVLHVFPVSGGDGMTAEELEALERALAEGSADIAAGRVIDASELLARLDSRP